MSFLYASFLPALLVKLLGPALSIGLGVHLSGVVIIIPSHYFMDFSTLLILLTAILESDFDTWAGLGLFFELWLQNLDVCMWSLRLQLFKESLLYVQ